MHVGKGELILSLALNVFCVFLAEEALPALLFAPFQILLKGHQDRGVQISPTHLRTDVIDIGCIVILHHLLDVVWTFQVDGRRVKIGHDNGGRTLHAKTGAQRVRLRA